LPVKDTFYSGIYLKSSLKENMGRDVDELIFGSMLRHLFQQIGLRDKTLVCSEQDLIYKNGNFIHVF